MSPPLQIWGTCHVTRLLPGSTLLLAASCRNIQAYAYVCDKDKRLTQLSLTNRATRLEILTFKKNMTLKPTRINPPHMISY